MSTIRTIIKRVLVALLFPKRINDFIIYARAIYSAMNGNANFPNAVNRLALLNAYTNQLEADEAGTRRKPATVTVAQRNVSLENVKKVIYSLRDNDVQPAADANPASAEAIIDSAAMTVRKLASHAPRLDKVKSGIVSGSVIITGAVKGPHEWQQSPDDGITIMNLDSTFTSKKTVNSLQPGTRLWFRTRPILRKSNTAAWSQWLSIIVQ